MSQRALSEGLKDVAVGLLAPFDEADPDTIMLDAYRETTAWLYDEGIRTYLACANITEYHSLSHEERIELVRATCETLPEDATILGGAGGSTKTAIALSQAHEEHGADGIMVMPPDHVFKHEQGVVAYYHRIADAVDIGVVPYLRGMEITVPQVTEICRHENVEGIKWAVSDIELFSECVQAVTSDVVWVCGMGEPPAPAYWLEGAEGFSAGVTNFEPRLGQAMFAALTEGEYERARELRKLSFPFMNLRSETGENNSYPQANSIPIVKCGLALAGQDSGAVREPLVELPGADRDRAEAAYVELQEGLEEMLPVAQ